MSDIQTSRRSVLLTLSALPVISLAAQAGGEGMHPELNTAATAPVRSAGSGGTVAAATSAAPRGTRGIFTRMPDLDLESYNDYLSGRAKWGRKISDIAEKRGEEILRAHGIDLARPTDMKVQDIAALLFEDPVIARQSRFAYQNHYDGFVTLRNYFHSNADYYENMLAAAEKTGPGTLIMSPGMDIPDYTKHEIHNQVGGYMGDPFAGLMYFYGTQLLADGGNEQDVMFDAIAKSIPLPPDGKVRRILENGTGPGQLATALKRRFPDAEVWGIDVAGPMVRYAHLRANQMGTNVNFAQRLAEDNGFPDNHFDIITSSSFHHEVTEEGSKKIFREVHRVLRPGGVYRPADSGLNGYPETAMGKLDHFLDWRMNHEVWMMEWGDMDRVGAMKAAGLKVDPDGLRGLDTSVFPWWLQSIKLTATKA